MQALIYVALTKSTLTAYELDLLQWAKATLPEITIFDFDNHSASSLADYAIELIKRSDITIVVLANSEAEEVSLGPAMQLLQFITREKRYSVKLLLHGRHAIVEKMGKALKEPIFYQILEEKTVKEKILDFIF